MNNQTGEMLIIFPKKKKAPENDYFVLNLEQLLGYAPMPEKQPVIEQVLEKNVAEKTASVGKSELLISPILLEKKKKAAVFFKNQTEKMQNSLKKLHTDIQTQKANAKAQAAQKKQQLLVQKKNKLEEKRQQLQQQEAARALKKEKKQAERIIKKEKFRENLQIYKFTFVKTLKSALQFIATSAAIFTIIFLISNYQAYAEIASAWLGRQLGIEEDNAALIAAENQKPKPRAEKLLPMELIKDSEKLKATIPELNLEVMPTEDRIVIPKINKNIPLIRTSLNNYKKQKWDILDKEILDDLLKGAVLYPSSIIPGRPGNTVVTAHSSNYFWQDSPYNDAFARLHEVILGDRIYIYFDQKKYTYEVEEIMVVKPEQVEVMYPEADEDILTVITCTPVGTNKNRLVVRAKRI